MMTIINLKTTIRNLKTRSGNIRSEKYQYTTSSLNKLYLIKPIASYTNCDIEKNNIFTAAKNYADVGVIYCWVNNKCYVGSSINFITRLYKYYSTNSLKSSKSAIYTSLLKYGYSNFSLHILECCNKNETIKKEQYYIDTLLPEYNILKKAGSLLGFKHSDKTIKTFKNRIVSAETRNSLSAAASKTIYSNKEKSNLSISHLGKKLSLITRTKISDSAIEL